MHTRVYLVRHGETVWNREKRTQGWTDIELNAHGRRQAEAIAQALHATPLRAVYASTLRRAIATAQAVAARHGLAVLTDPDLRELNQGAMDGLTTEEMLRDFAAVLDEWRICPGPLKLPEGESMAELQERAWTAVGRIVAGHPGEVVAVVSHNLAIITILSRLLGLDLNNFRRLRQDVAAINVLEFGPSGPAIIRLNDVSHLSSLEANK